MYHNPILWSCVIVIIGTQFADLKSIQPDVSVNLPIPRPDVKKLSVGILGAGMAGLYAGMILQTLGIDYEILEANRERTGGRVFTYRFNGVEGLNAKPGTPEYYDYYDGGAMRFPKNDYTGRLNGNKTWSLINFLNDNCLACKEIKLVPYYYMDGNGGNGILYYNGIKATVKEASSEEQKGDFFHVGIKNNGTVPDGEIDYAGKPPDFWENQSTHEFVDEVNKNYSKGFETMLDIDTSPREYFRRNFSYPQELIDWMELRFQGTSAYTNYALMEIIFDDSEFAHEEWVCVDGGTDRIVEGMVKFLRNSPKLGRKVVKLSPQRNGTGSIVGVQVKTKNSIDNGTHISNYTHVISTLPVPILRTLDTSECNFSYGKNTAIRVLLFDNAVKVALRFKTRFWQNGEAPIIGGHSRTDLPPRAIVYPSYGVNCSEAPGVLIASYTWTKDAEIMGALPADEVVESCLQTLEILHGPVVRQEFDGSYHIQNWNQYEYSRGAYAYFGPGQFKHNYPWLRKPEVDGRLFFAGEASSQSHTWVVGALNSAYLAVAELINTLSEDAQNDLMQKLKKEWGIFNATEPDYKLFQELTT